MKAIFSRGLRFMARKSIQSALGPALSQPRAYMVSPGQPVWMNRDYSRFADEAYVRNVIAHRSIALLSESAASIPLGLNVKQRGQFRELSTHPILSLLAQPSPLCSGQGFFQSLYHYKLISGNAYVLAVGPGGEPPRELHLLRPDRVAIIAGRQNLPAAYRYQVGERYTDHAVDAITGRCRVLHLKTFHPLNDWYGLSPIEAAAYSIDQHNQSGAWNQALLQNGARPSGALVVKSEQGTGSLSDEQYRRIREQMDEQFSGAANAGRPLLLEGGLDWREMSLSPRDMDFIQAKHSAARDIALAFGVPPQMLGIPGDNTYANLQEARLAMWEQTVLPMVEQVASALSGWLSPMYGREFLLTPDIGAVPALAVRNQAIWERVERASFLTNDEKRAAVGYGPMNANPN